MCHLERLRSKRKGLKMLTLFNNILGALPWLGLGGGAIFGVLGYFLGFPQLLSIIASLLDIASPVLKGFVEGAVWFFGKFVSGLGVIFTNLSVVAVLIVAALASAGVAYDWEHSNVKQCEERLDITARQLVQYRNFYNAHRQ